MTIENKKNLYDYAYRNMFIREYRQFNQKNISQFKRENHYFLNQDLTEDQLRFEFCCFHLHKWIGRLGLKFTAEDTKEYVRNRWEDFLNT